MKVGQIIKLAGEKDGYMRIIDVLGGGTYEVECEGDDSTTRTVIRRDIEAPTVVSLCISEDLFFALKRLSKDKITHLATERWMTVVRVKPKIVRLYTAAKHYEGIFYVKEAIRRKSIGENIVEITIGKQIF